MTTEEPEETTVYHETVFYLGPQYYYLFLSIKTKQNKPLFVPAFCSRQTKYYFLLRKTTVFTKGPT